MMGKITNEMKSLSNQDNELAKETLLLLDKYRKLQDRYTALLTLNQLANDPLEILVDNHVIAQGEVVIVDGTLVFK